MAWFKHKEKVQVTATVSVTLVQPQNDYVPPADKRTNICPNCGATLAKVPGAKTKCPHCGRFMYVRTDPHINARVVVGEDDLEAVDDAIAVANGTWEERKASKAHRAKATADLTKSFGFAPSEADVTWRVLNEDFLDAVKRGDGYAIFTTSGGMTNELVRAKKYADAVRMVARVIVNWWVDQDHDIPPAWIQVVDKALKNGITLDEARDLFIAGAAGISAIPRYRVDAAKVWEGVLSQLGK